ncbi:NAD(P)H-hydrate epimerase, partial [Trichinella pseudospiralis]
LYKGKETILIVRALTFYGLNLKTHVRKTYKRIMSLIRRFTPVSVVSIDIPSGCHPDEGPIKPDALKPKCLISLNVSKKCAEKFSGKSHIFAGRFIPKRFDEKFELHLPQYSEGHDYILLSTTDSIHNMARERNDIFMADCIMNERIRKGKKEYLVRWEGYSEEYDTWEPAAHILGQELLKEFKEAKKKGFKNAYEYNQYKKNHLRKTTAKKVKKELEAPTTKNAVEQVRRKYKSGCGKQQRELSVSDDDKIEVTSSEEHESDSREESEAEKRFSDWIRTMPLSSQSGPSTGKYSRSTLTVGECEEKLNRFLKVLRERAKKT